MKENNFRQNLYEFAFMILAVKNVLDSSTLIKRPEWFDLLLITVFFGSILWKLALQTYTWGRILILTGFGMLCAYTCVKGDYFYIIFSFFGIIAIQDVDLKAVLKKTSRIKIILILIHVIAYFVIMIISPAKIHLVYRNGVMRHYFMLGHPNTFSMYVIWTSLEYIYARYEKFRIPNLLFVWFINAATYYFTNSNTGIMVATTTITLLILDKWEKKKQIAFIKPVSKYCFIACAIFIPLLIASYSKLSGGMLVLFNVLNPFFSGRLLYGAYAYDVYGFSLIGRSIDFAEKTFWRGHWFDTIIFDNAYIWMFVMYGYLYLIVVSISFIWISKKTTTLEKILIIAITFYGIMEAYIINAAICFPLLFIGKYFYATIQEKKEKKLSSKFRIAK